MSRTRRLEIRLGAIAWVACALYFPLQLVVASAWPRRYSFGANKISDLGVTSCEASDAVLEGGVLVCSPWHALMNAGFVIFGVLTAAGAVLIWRALPRTRLLTIALSAVFVAGMGGVIVGCAPNDVAPGLHRAGALLRVPGVLAPFFVALTLREERPRLAAFSCGTAALGVIGLALFARHGSGEWSGALERLALDPFTLWTLVMGAALLRGTSEDAS